MCAYSIDLGIHLEATRSCNGSEFRPMQVALTQGILLPERGEGPCTGFKPVALASFHQIKANDTLIFRVFNTSAICPFPGPQLESVGPLTLEFTDLRGEKATTPWQDEENFPFSIFENEQISLAFTSEPGGMTLPCYHQHYQDRPNEIVIHTVGKPASSIVPYLFSVVVGAEIGTPMETQTVYYRDDPEMVISSDDRPGCGGEDPRRDQLAGIAATSR